MSTVLDTAGEHKRLVQDADHLCEVAGISKSMLAHSATEFCSAGEVDWLRAYRRHLAAGRYGWYRHNDPKVAMKFQAMVAALVRNHVDARFITIGELVEADDYPDATVLFVPNFQSAMIGKPFAAWQLQKVYDLLLHRFTAQSMTVLSIQNLGETGQQYGGAIYDLINSYYNPIQ